MGAYTIVDWRVKPGRELEFVEKWKEIAAANKAQFDPNGWAKLLRDEKDPAHFVSLGEWPEVHTIEQWFVSEGFKERMDQTRELVDGMTPHMFTQAASV